MRTLPMPSGSREARPGVLGAPLVGEPAPLSSDIDEIVAYMRHIAQRDHHIAQRPTR